VDAAKRAISSPLLEEASIQGARGVIINVTGGPDLSLTEACEASAIIQEAAHEEANIIFGAVVDPTLEGRVKITVIATGFDRPGAAKPSPSSSAQTPVDLQGYSSWYRPRPAMPAETPAASAPVGRRGVLQVPAQTPAAATDRATGMAPSAPGAEPAAAGEVTPLDVPAFLRRQGQA
jgi:cell division protein FtsZ